MPKPKCDCKTPLYWVIAYTSSSPRDGEIIAIEIHCSKHNVDWWWKLCPIE